MEKTFTPAHNNFLRSSGQMLSPPFYRLGNRVLDLCHGYLVMKSILGTDDLNALSKMFGFPGSQFRKIMFAQLDSQSYRRDPMRK